VTISTGREDAVVIGVGEPFRGDDGAGPRVVRALQGRVGPSVRLVERASEPTALLDLWDGVRLAIVVDAGRSGAAPGTVARLEGVELATAPAERTSSSHGLSLRDAVELGQALGRLPQRLVVYVIEAGDVGRGEGLTPAVAKGVEEAAHRVAAELSARVPPVRPRS
jgi:hydrogenase maturation protease